MFNQHFSRRRFLQASAALAALGVGLDACGSSGSGGNTQLQWFVNDDPVRNKWERSIAIPHFQNQFPKTQVKLVSVPWNEFDPKLTNMAAAGTLPDVWTQWGAGSFVGYAWRGLLADITSYLQKDSKAYTDFYPGVMEYGKYNGKQVGIPLDLGGTYCFYNKDIFDKAGLPYPPVNWDDKSWNWDKMLQYAKQLTTNYDNPNKAIYGVTFQIPLEEIVWLWGGDVYTHDVYETGVPHESHWSSQEAIDAIQAYADLTWVHKVSPSPAVVNALSSNGDPLATGRVAMTISGIWGFGTYQGATNLRWGAAAVPGMNANKTGIYADPWLISAHSKNPDAAWEFVKYLTSIDAARQYMQASGWPVPHTSLLPEWYGQFKGMKADDLKTLFEGQLKYGFLSAQNDIVAYDRIGAINSSEFDPVMSGKAKAKDVVAGLDQQLSRLFASLRP